MRSAGFYFGDLALTPSSELRTMGDFVPFSHRLTSRISPLEERIHHFEQSLKRLLALNGVEGEGMDPLLDWVESFELRIESPRQRFREADSACGLLIELLAGKAVRGSKQAWQELSQLRWESSVLVERATPRRSLCTEFYRELLYPFSGFKREEHSVLFATPLVMLDRVFEAPHGEAEEAISEFLARVREQFTDERYLQFARTTGDESRLLRAQRRMREHEDRMEMLTLLEVSDG